MQSFNEELYQLPMRFSPSLNHFTPEHRKISKSKPSPILSTITHEDSYVPDTDELKARKLFENYLNDSESDIESSKKNTEHGGGDLILDFNNEAILAFDRKAKFDIAIESTEPLVHEPSLECESARAKHNVSHRKNRQPKDQSGKKKKCKKQLQELQKVSENENSPPRRQTELDQLLESSCNCKKNKCNKMNCACFSSNKKCSKDCACDNCFNNKVLLTKRMQLSVITALKKSDIKQSFLLKRLNIF